MTVKQMGASRALAAALVGNVGPAAPAGCLVQGAGHWHALRPDRTSVYNNVIVLLPAFHPGKLPHPLLDEELVDCSLEFSGLQAI